MPDHEGNDALAQAQTTIRQQQAEIDRLRREAAYAEELRTALTVAATAGTIAAPLTHSRLLQLIVETATHVINARAGSLALVDKERRDLVFEVVLGERAAEVQSLRVPLGHGIAGLVAVSAQPIAISDAESDARQAGDVAERVGYTPHTIVCVPLLYQREVIGILELLDKEGGTFSPADMRTLGLFADQAAVAIEQSRTNRSLTALVRAALQSADGEGEAGERSPQELVSSFTADIEENDPFYRDAIELAQLVQEIAWRGQLESAACRAILNDFAQYLRNRRSRPATIGVPTW